MPHLRELLGEDEFGAVAARYIDTHPSQFASIRWFGDRLAQELERSHPEQPWFAELARWEWALAASFDAQDAPAVGIEALATIAPDAWASCAWSFIPPCSSWSCRPTRRPCSRRCGRTSPPEPAILAVSAILAAVAAGSENAVPFAGAARDCRADGRARRRELRRDVRSAVRMARGGRSAARRRRVC